jgi:DNA-binding response OmpR family regulator
MARVLLADDDPDLRELIGDALRDAGHEVLEAEHGAHLIELLSTFLLDAHNGPPADLVVSDLRMPGVTGLSVLAGLRAQRTLLPFILITAFGDAETHAEAGRLGAVVLDKPFELTALIALVRTQLPQA